MSTNKPTAAEKRKATLAAKAERERQEQAAFVAKSKATGGRKAKVAAKEKAVWKVDQPTSRKRTSSTVQVSETVKKARGTKDTEGEYIEPAPELFDSDAAAEIDEEHREIPAVSSKVKASGRKHVPATIEDSQDSSPETKKAVKSAAAVTKVKAVVAKGLRILGHGKPSAKKTTIVKPNPARVIADSASEDEAISSEEHSDEVSSGQSDKEDIQDVAPNEEEFQIEVPRVVPKYSTTVPNDVEKDSSSDKMKDLKGKGKARSLQKLPDSDNESIEIDKPRAKDLRRYEPESDDTLSDAPERIVIDSDVDMPKAVDKGHHSLHSRRSSAASWSSGQEICVPDSEDENHVDDIASRKHSRRSSCVDEEDMCLHEAIARELTTVPRTHGRRASIAESRRSSRVDDEDMRLHEAIARELTTVPRTHGRRASIAESDADDSMDEDVHPVPKKKSRKVSAAHQRQAETERPQVRPAPAGPPGKLSNGHAAQLDRIAAATADATSRPESDWHISARIMFPAPGKDIGLTNQTEELKGVLRGCIDFIKLSLLFEDAYPTILSRSGFARTYLISAAQQPSAIHIKERLMNDLSFAARLADIPMDRINILRGDFKRFACQDVPGFYKFALLAATEVKKLANDLLQDHRYIFPADPTTGRLKTELPFQHAAIVSVLKKAVFTGQFRTKNLHLFASTSEKHPDRLELPDAMVCLAATAVYGGLVEYRATGKQQNIPFTEGAYEDIYRNHMKTLSDTRASAPTALHRVLHHLYNLVTETTSASSVATGSSAVLINLVEVEDSD